MAERLDETRVVVGILVPDRSAQRTGFPGVTPDLV